MTQPEIRQYHPLREDGWSTGGELRFYHHGFDFLIYPKKAAFRYEDACFAVLSARLSENRFAIGPHLVDTLFGHSAGWHDDIRPDAIIFDQKGSEWVLSGLAEFKSGKVNGTKRKLDGFSALLAKLRASPFYLRKFMRL